MPSPDPDDNYTTDEMVSTRVLASYVFGLALLALSSAQNANEGWIKTTMDESDKQRLYSALKDVKSYSPGITTLICVKDTLSLEMAGEQAGSTGGSTLNAPNPNAGKDTLFHYDVVGCEVDAEADLGFCRADLTCDQAPFDVYLTQPTGTDTIKVTSVLAKN
ncbi:hypothetical protein F441_15206 [Phytophthora nicotianae CJ01A1]|uniref:Uncharacterized protein n=2 Tax=Phytophthora nicotianae TaxID=4792 RepID=W2WET1_PHYNI|nr:hypothetical protein F441_15206 [Phytophthora nicotianae CJ01A1]